MTAFGDNRLPARFWAKVQPDEATGCWLWTGADNRDGYGSFGLDAKTQNAHRVAYQALVGPVPDGLELDHLCRVRPCVNPGHLEPVTHAENILRGVSPSALHATKTHCLSGHAYDAENTYMYRGKRNCRSCNRGNQRDYRLRRERRVAALEVHSKGWDES